MWRKLPTVARLADLPAVRQARKTMFYVYVLQSQTRSYLYVGLTNNVKRRVDQHQAGREKTTRPYIPFKLLFTESFLNRVQARAREKYLKSGIGKEWIKNKYC